jgi:hypothetical protein
LRPTILSEALAKTWPYRNRRTADVTHEAVDSRSPTCDLGGPVRYGGLFRSWAVAQAEILGLRHGAIDRPGWVAIGNVGRLMFVGLYRFALRLKIVQPETVG